MNSTKEKTHSFIVRVWLEPREKKGAPPEWRGVVEHVASGERNYLKDLNEIISFIAPYIEKMGIKTSRPKRLRKWLIHILQNENC